MKVLWMSNVSLLTRKIDKTGTWIHSMYDHLRGSNEVTVCCNITLGNGSSINKKTEDRLTQYEIPIKWIKKNGLPAPDVEKSIIRIIKEEQPDIIHVWGVELFWGLFAHNNQLDGIPFLIEIQGLKGVCSNSLYFYGGLSVDVLKSMRGLMEYIFPQGYVFNQQKEFEKWGEYEKTILENARYINTQSDWVRSIISSYSTKAHVFKTGIILRREFTDSSIWADVHVRSQNINLFSVTSRQAYKGTHITIQAFAIVKKKYPNAKLRIAGISINPIKYKRSGYDRFLIKLIEDLDLKDSVVFLGNLEAKDILEEFYQSDVCINSSFVETYCLALAEALCVGIPCVASYTSALSELMEDCISGLYYPMGDHYLCAKKILQFVEDEHISRLISKNASTRMRHRSESGKIVQQQIEIYKHILADFQNKE